MFNCLFNLGLYRLRFQGPKKFYVLVLKVVFQIVLSSEYEALVTKLETGQKIYFNGKLISKYNTQYLKKDRENQHYIQANKISV